MVQLLPCISLTIWLAFATREQLLSDFLWSKNPVDTFFGQSRTPLRSCEHLQRLRSRRNSLDREKIDSGNRRVSLKHSKASIKTELSLCDFFTLASFGLYLFLPFSQHTHTLYFSLTLFLPFSQHTLTISHAYSPTPTHTLSFLSSVLCLGFCIHWIRWR